MRKILKEHEEDWFNEGDRAYIGRTKAYYADVDDGSVYTPDYWTYDTDPNCADFAGEVYELSEDELISEGSQFWCEGRES